MGLNGSATAAGAASMLLTAQQSTSSLARIYCCMSQKRAIPRVVVVEDVLSELAKHTHTPLLKWWIEQQ